jgi:hypothetical protein
MASAQDSINGIASWLQQQFGGATVNANADGDREVVVFRIGLDGGRGVRRLEISQEALDHTEPEVILADLHAEGVVQRLLADPTMQLHYYGDRRVPHFEELPVICDGRRYRVVRDAQHNVRILDSEDKPLINSPRGMLVMPESIHARSLAEWWREIRGWRGNDQ